MRGLHYQTERLGLLPLTRRALRVDLSPAAGGVAPSASQPLHQIARKHRQRIIARTHDDDAVAGLGEF